MKKTAAIIAALTLCSLSALSVSANDNIVGDALRGAESIVDDAISGVEDIVTPGDSDGPADSVTDSTVSTPESTPSTQSPAETTVTTPQTTAPGNTTDNANTGVPIAEIATIGAAAFGGLATTMAISLRRKK